MKPRNYAKTPKQYGFVPFDGWKALSEFPDLDEFGLLSAQFQHHVITKVRAALRARTEKAGASWMAGRLGIGVADLSAKLNGHRNITIGDLAVWSAVLEMPLWKEAGIGRVPPLPSRTVKPKVLNRDP
jgi:hypothetical protein